MFSIPRSYKVRTGNQRLYAVGDRQAVIQAVRDTFLNHGMAIHKEKDQVIYYYPGGWLDRAGSAVTRFQTASGVPPESDCFSVKYAATNNPLVTTLFVNFYQKTGWFREKKIEQRMTSFYSAFAHEFRIFQIPLIDADEWPAIVQQFPELYCSPVWKTTEEIRISNEQKMTPEHRQLIAQLELESKGRTK